MTVNDGTGHDGTGPGGRTGGRIVVGVDDSAGARAAVAFGLREAARRGARVEAVVSFLIPPYWPGPYGLPAAVPPTPLDDIRAMACDVATRVVDEVRAGLAGELAPMPEVAVRAIGGHPAVVLVDLADGADMLVVGSRGHGAAVGMLIGSVSLHCVLHARCPVTIVHPHGEPADLREAAARAASPVEH
jgi:nucleotide-binding universal stress UspA family protein